MKQFLIFILALASICSPYRAARCLIVFYTHRKKRGLKDIRWTIANLSFCITRLFLSIRELKIFKWYRKWTRWREQKKLAWCACRKWALIAHKCIVFHCINLLYDYRKALTFVLSQLIKSLTWKWKKKKKKLFRIIMQKLN